MTVATRSGPPRQQHFPPRRRLTVASTKSDLKERRRRRTVDQTLTQMPCFSTSFQSDCADEKDSDEDFEEPRPKKRRKMVKRNKFEVREVDQATLTQKGIGWYVPDTYSDEEEEEEEEEEDSEVGVDEQDDEDSDDHDQPQHQDGEADAATESEFEGFDQKNVNVDVDDASPSRGKQTPITLSSPRNHRLLTPSPTRNAQRQTASASPMKSSHTSPIIGESPVYRRPTAASATSPQLPVTPVRRFPRSIPSSQSPATTPLSMASGSPTKRTPLQELHQNVWAQRDQSPTPQRRKTVPDSEDVDDEKENWNLDLDEEGSEKGSPTKSSPKVNQLKMASAKASPTRDEDTLAMPPPLLRARLSDPSSSASQIHFTSQPTPDEQTSSTAPPLRSFHSPQLSRTIHTSQSQSLAEVSPSVPQYQEPSIRLSQATTVDITQPSPRSAQASPVSSTQPADVEGNGPRIYVPQIPPSPPPIFESQFTYSIFGQDSSEDWARRYGNEDDSQERNGIRGL